MAFKKSYAERAAAYRRKNKVKITPAGPGAYGENITEESLSQNAGKPPVPPKTVSPYKAPGPDESWKDQTYFDTTAGVTKSLDNLKGYLVNASEGLGQDAGVTFDRNPDNPLQASNFRIEDNVDVTNPFSRAALLKRSYQQAQAGNTNSYAARGQLYSGALQNAQNETGRSKLQADDALIKDFSGKYGGLYQKWLEGQSDAGARAIDAQVAATERNKDAPIPTPGSGGNQKKAATGFQDIAFKDLAQAGITVDISSGKIVVKDKQGNVIPGATFHSFGKRRVVRVPKGG